MAKKLYGLSESDRKKVNDLLNRPPGRRSSRPVPTRRRDRTGAPAQRDIFGLLVADVPAISVNYNTGDPILTPGQTNAAVYPLYKDVDGDGLSLFAAGGASAIRAINPLWPEIIKAGTTTDADKPVVVRGYVDNAWVIADGEEDTQTVTAFVLTNVIYPVTIMAGQAQGAVSGSGNVTLDNLSVLWGRNPGTSTISAANPEAWDGDDNAVAFAIQIPDGTWRLIYLACPE
jgi:hypothetical protein